MSRRVIASTASFALAVAITGYSSTAPASATAATCDETGGLLTITLPAGANGVDLAYDLPGNALDVDVDGASAVCAAGHFTTSVLLVAFAPGGSATSVKVTTSNPWVKPGGELVDVDLMDLTSLSQVTLWAAGSTVAAPVTATSLPVGLDLDADGETEVTFDPVSSLVVFGGNGDDVIDLSAPVASGVFVNAGAGADTVVTSIPGTYVLGVGADQFTGGTEDDEVDPGDGLDLVHSGGSALGDLLRVSPDSYSDVIDGGGDSELSLADSSEDVSVSDDGFANDGSYAFDEGDNYTGIASVVGGSGDDIIDLAGIDSADGYLGDDVFLGADGDKTVLGGPGDNLLDLSGLSGAVAGIVDGSSGDAILPPDDPGQGVISYSAIDQLIGTPYADDFTATCPSCVVEPGLGNDDVTLTGGIFRASATPDGQDTVSGNGLASYDLRTSPVNVSLDTAADAPRDDGAPGEKDDIRSRNVTGGQGNDTLSGDNTANELFGEGGNDTIFGRGGADLIAGEDGNDNLNGSNGNDVVGGQAGIDVVRGGDGDDVIDGDAAGQEFPDTLDGGQGDDDEFGRGGDDTFLQGGNGFDNGSDVMDGGAGTDTVSYLGRTSGINATVNAVMDDGAPGEGDQIRATVESLTGGNGDDVLQGGAAAGTLLGNGGNDKLDGRGGNDTVRGGVGDDLIVETTAANGADLLYGDDGADTVTYLGRTAGVNVTKDALANDGSGNGSEGDNVRPDIETVIGTNFADVLTGGGLDDWLYGRGGNDTLTGKAGSDSMYGELGDDTIFAKDNKVDTLDGGGGTDSAQYDAIDLRTLIEITLP